MNPGSEAGGKGEGRNGGRIDRSYYDHSAYFDGVARLHDFQSRFQRYRVEKVLALHSPRATDRVLDLGCGWGTITYALAPRAKEVVGLDFAERAIAMCTARLARAGLDNVVFRVGDARDSGCSPETFDVVVAADLFEHLYPEDSEAVAAEGYRVLKPGGTFVVWTPCRSHVIEVLKNNDILLKRDVSHVDYKSMPRMKEILAKAGFGIRRATFVESHLPGLNLLERLAQRWVPLLRRRIGVVGRKPRDAR